jgi:phosphohistidine phosphatase SixA
MPYLVRHAHAGNKQHWTGPDQARPLSPTGQREAHGLLAVLRDSPISRILSSPTIRCKQTVAPLAERRTLALELTDELAVDAHVSEVQALLVDPSLQTAVLCTHGEVIGQVIGRLAADGLDLGGPPRWEKGSTWLLDTAGGVVTGARYLAPLRLRDDPAGHG